MRLLGRADLLPFGLRRENYAICFIVPVEPPSGPTPELAKPLEELRVHNSMAVDERNGSELAAVDPFLNAAFVSGRPRGCIMAFADGVEHIVELQPRIAF